MFWNIWENPFDENSEVMTDTKTVSKPRKKLQLRASVFWKPHWPVFPVAIQRSTQMLKLSPNEHFHQAS
jgi:hypothetical protein